MARSSANSPQPDHRRLDLRHWHLHLATARPDPSGGGLGEPADVLTRGAVLRAVRRRGHVRMQRRGP
jgi:hypothetical protein